MTNMQNKPFETFSDALADAAEKAGASIQTIHARRRLPASGIAFTPNLILTANHVVEREENLHITTPEGSSYPATLLGRDPISDLAVLDVKESMLHPAEKASKKTRVGQIVLSLGRLGQEGLQASLGVVSATGGPLRTGRGGLLENYIRSDTIPYPGFSGGALVDVAGDVLGLNTSGFTPGSSITIPADFAWSLAQALAENGTIRRGYLGIRSQPVKISTVQSQALGRQQTLGLLLVNVEENGPAAQAGLLVGDILVGLAGLPISDPDELLARLSSSVVGKSIPAEVLRGGQRLEIAVKIGERP